MKTYILILFLFISHLTHAASPEFNELLTCSNGMGFKAGNHYVNIPLKNDRFLIVSAAGAIIVPGQRNNNLLIVTFTPPGSDQLMTHNYILENGAIDRASSYGQAVHDWEDESAFNTFTNMTTFRYKNNVGAQTARKELGLVLLKAAEFKSSPAELHKNQSGIAWALSREHFKEQNNLKKKNGYRISDLPGDRVDINQLDLHIRIVTKRLEQLSNCNNINDENLKKAAALEMNRRQETLFALGDLLMETLLALSSQITAQDTNISQSIIQRTKNVSKVITKHLNKMNRPEKRRALDLLNRINNVVTTEPVLQP